MVIDFKVTYGYRTYQVFWKEGNLAEMWLVIAGECVSEWRGEIDQILEIFHFQTGVMVTLPK